MLTDSIDTDPALRLSFEEQARNAGLALPGPRRFNRWLAVALIGVVVAASLGVGQWTGWAIGPRHGMEPTGLYGATECAGAPADVSVLVPGVVGAISGSSLSESLGRLGGAFQNWSGECAHLEISTSQSDGYVPQLASRAVLFAAGIDPPNASDLTALGAAVEVVPQLLTEVVVLCDLPGLSTPLRLNGSVIAGIYEGQITSWSDPEIAALNPGLHLSGQPPIVPVHLGDSASINLPLTALLSVSSLLWNRTVGRGPAVEWPAGIGVNGTPEMAAKISSTPGAIGYLGSFDPLPRNGTPALLENPAGEFIGPGPANATAAAASVASSPTVSRQDWANLSIIDAPGPDSYPMVEMVFATVFLDLGAAYGGALGESNATWLLTVLWWVATDAATAEATLGLAPLPTPFVAIAQSTIENVTYNGYHLVEPGESGGETGEF